MTELDILDSLESTSGSNDKKEILEAWCKHQKLNELMDAAMNYKRKFWIKKFDDVHGTQDAPGYDLHVSFLTLLFRLESRILVGNAAIEAVEGFLRMCSKNRAKWYARVIRKDLRIGVSVGTANKCGFDIEEFDVQLAKDGHACKKLNEMFKKGVLASRKYNGYRCLAIVDSEDDSVTLYTRSGEVFGNFPMINETLALFINKQHNSKYVFDGEIMSDNFNKTQKSAFASKRKTVVGDMKFHIFDMIPYDEWIAENFKMTAFKRYELLKTFFMMWEDNPAFALAKDRLRLVEKQMVYSVDEILELEKQWVVEGFEGAMANPDIPYYKGKHSNKMLKFKTFQSMDCEVLDVYRGVPGKKYENTMGGLTVMQENGVTCDVGSGFDDDERDEIWANPKAVIGRVVEIYYQELSVEDKRMIFPSFQRWRPDKE